MLQRTKIHLTRPVGLLTLAAAASLMTVGSASAPAVFSTQTGGAGLTVSSCIPADSPGAPMRGGAAVGDFDNDGWPDLFVIGGGCAPDKLFINNHDGTFTDQAALWGLGDLYRGNGVAVGDFDNDGDLDIFVTSAGDMSGAPNASQHRLYRNNIAQGSASFTNVAVAAGVNFTSTTRLTAFGAAFGDYDLDGCLDLFVASWHPKPETSDGNRLFHNNCNGTFTDLTVAAGVYDTTIAGFSPRFVDMDGDRYPELLIAADWGTSHYFHNNGDGTFTNLTSSAGVGLDHNGMGTTVGDLNQDGRPDWYVTSIEAHDGNFVYVNQGNNVFSALPSGSGAKKGAWGWGTEAVDIDNDGDLDLVETNGWFTPEWKNKPSYLFRNNGNLTFSEIHTDAGFTNLEEGRTLLFLDYDRDGDMDIVITSNNDTIGGPLNIYRNDLVHGSNTHWLQVVLNTNGMAGLAPNGFGSKLRAAFGGTYHYYSLAGGSSYLGQSELVAHFGLESATQVDELMVQWPNGSTSVLTNVAADQRITVTPPGTFTPSLSMDPVAVVEGNSGFTSAVFTAKLSAKSPMDVFVDYATSPLTATAGVDYISTSGTLMIPAGSTTATVTVQVVGDTEVEQSEAYTVVLSSPVNAVLANTEARGSIVDDDGTFLFVDDFEDGVQTWTVGNPTWVESGGSMNGTMTSLLGATAYAPLPWPASGLSGCAVCTLETVMRSAGGSSASLWVIGWRQDSKNYIYLVMDDGRDQWTLNQVAAGVLVKSSKIRQTVDSNVSYKVKMTYDGTVVNAYVNDVLTLSLTPTQALSGNVALRAFNTTGSWDYVRVY